MNLKLKVEEDVELRQNVKDLIVGQVKSIIHDEIKSIVETEITGFLKKKSFETRLENIFKDEIKREFNTMFDWKIGDFRNSNEYTKLIKDELGVQFLKYLELNDILIKDFLNKYTDDKIIQALVDKIYKLTNRK